MKRIVKHYPDELKLKVVKEYLSTDISKKDIMVKYDIRGCGNIGEWMLKFGMKAPSGEQLKLQGLMSKQSKRTAEETTLQVRIHELEKSLEYEKLKSLALETMIDVAERDLKITIRKKSGAKQ